jgi:hypothetical protein
METIPDWLTAIGNRGREVSEIEIDRLLPHDLLIVTTAHTHYGFTIISGRDATLETNRKDRPLGPVRLRGCTFGNSSSIKPDQIFCGGNLEFNFERDGTWLTYLTTTITALRHLRKSQS